MTTGARRKNLEEDFEVIWLEIKLQETRFLIGCVYRAPDATLRIFDYLDYVMRYATRNKQE
jgi:hypothetical protein